MYASPVREQICHDRWRRLDIKVRQHFAIRIIQAEYLMTRFDNFNTGTAATQNDMRLSSGIVFRFGGNGAPPPQVTVVLGQPGFGLSRRPGHGDGDGRRAGSQAERGLWLGRGSGVTATGDGHGGHRSLAPGSYTVKCGVKEGKPGKEGLKPVGIC
jgi:hypothetical protein